MPLYLDLSVMNVNYVFVFYVFDLSVFMTKVRSDLLIHKKNYFLFQYMTRPKKYHLPTGKHLMKFHLPDPKKH